LILSRAALGRVTDDPRFRHCHAAALAVGSSRRRDPFVYLRDVIERVSTRPARLVVQLTPREWKRLRQDLTRQAAA
jgi:hypothetical protein